jgi:septal ring factor EnvC (AmiA/AmiB activator)
LRGKSTRVSAPAWRCLALALALASSLAQAAHPTERSKQKEKAKAEAEANRAGIQQKLTVLKRDMRRTESEKEDVADTLAETEVAISDANRSLRELGDEQRSTNAKLDELAASQDRLAATIATQKKQLAALLREQYVAGNEDRIKLLLSGDNPNRINRDLQLMAYVSQAQARLLGALRANLDAVENNRLAAQNAKDELEEIAQDERDQKAVLEKEKKRRAGLLGALASRLQAQRKEAGSLERDAARMNTLVDMLSKQIREQAAAAAAEQRRQEALAAARAKAAAEASAAASARAQAERERLAREAARPGAKPVPAPKPEPVQAERTPVRTAPAEPEKRAEPLLGPAAPAGAFASLRGQMHAPTPGKLTVRFGAKFGDASWKGVFIKATEGADVRAVAPGRVVEATWMRGFGNIIAVDHGGDYLAIYANNETLFKRKGDPVKAGEAIASAGSSGGVPESGLYFELRYQGKPIDPAIWIKF